MFSGCLHIQHMWFPIFQNWVPYGFFGVCDRERRCFRVRSYGTFGDVRLERLIWKGVLVCEVWIIFFSKTKWRFICIPCRDNKYYDALKAGQRLEKDRVNVALLVYENRKCDFEFIRVRNQESLSIMHNVRRYGRLEMGYRPLDRKYCPWKPRATTMMSQWVSRGVPLNRTVGILTFGRVPDESTKVSLQETRLEEFCGHGTEKASL